MNFKKLNSNVILDKAIDGAFVFIGIFFAFFFTKCQQDRVNTRELNYHLSQIMKGLPDEEPVKPTETLKVEQKKNEDGTCAVNLNLGVTIGSVAGEKHLDVLLYRGLGTYLKEKDIITLASAYFDFLKKANQKAVQLFNEGSESGSVNKKCFSDAEIEIIESKLKPMYKTFRRSEEIADKVGFLLYGKLKKLGIKNPGIQNIKL